MDDVTDIRDIYNAGWDVEDSRLERHQLERDITWLYLDKYLPSGGQILEVGAATGRYTLELARRGYNILVVDLAQYRQQWSRSHSKGLTLFRREDFESLSLC